MNSLYGTPSFTEDRCAGVIPLDGFLHLSPSALVPGLEKICSLEWHNNTSPMLQEDREILFGPSLASSLVKLSYLTLEHL